MTNVRFADLAVGQKFTDPSVDDLNREYNTQLESPIYTKLDTVQCLMCCGSVFYNAVSDYTKTFFPDNHIIVPIGDLE